MLPGASLAWIHLVMSQTLSNSGSGDAVEGTEVSKGFTHKEASFAITCLQSQRRGCGPVCSTGIDLAKGSFLKNSCPFLIITAPRFPKCTHLMCASVLVNSGSYVMFLSSILL